MRLIISWKLVISVQQRLTSSQRHWYLCYADEDDEDGRRAAVGPLQVLAAGVFRKHPSGDSMLELLTTSQLPVTIGPVFPGSELSSVAVHGKRLQLLEVDGRHRRSSPTWQITHGTRGGETWDALQYIVSHHRCWFCTVHTLAAIRFWVMLPVNMA